MITRDIVRELFFYEPSTGWLISRNGLGGCKSGRVSGSIDSRGYLQVSIKNVKHLAHRIVWMYHFGRLPKRIDHANGVTTDNRLENLRPATLSQNRCNSRINSDNKSGFKGVCEHGNSRWRARIRIDGKKLSLGSFDTPEAAHAAYCKASAEHHGEYGRVS